MPLPDHAGVIAPRLQVLGDGIAGAVEGVEDRHAIFVGILAGEERGPARGTDRVGDKRIGEPGTGGGKPVEVRRRIHLRAIARDRMLGMVIGENKDDVGPLRGRGHARHRHEPHPADIAAGGLGDRLGLDAERVLPGGQHDAANVSRLEGLEVAGFLHGERDWRGGSFTAGIDRHPHRAPPCPAPQPWSTSIS